MFWRSMLPPSSGLKSKPRKKPALLATCIILVSHFDLLFNPEDGWSVFLWNNNYLLPDYLVLK
jgi:hypothetical protein